MSDVRRISVAACVLLLAVRLSIGWQFLYEGLWKLNSQNAPKPWTAAGYLKNSQGPFRTQFRNLTGDPNDLDWLDYEIVVNRWDDWRQRFLAHHPDFSDEQEERLDRMLNGKPENFRAKLDELPEGVKWSGSLSEVVWFDKKRKRLFVHRALHMTPRERIRVLAMVSVETNPSEANREKNEIAKAFHKAVNDVYKRSSRLTYKEQLAASLIGDAQRAGAIIREKTTGKIVEEGLGEIDLYRLQLDRYEQNLAKATQAFQHDHLKKQWAELQQLRAQLVGPVKALEAKMKVEARKLLTAEQLARGPVPMPPTSIDRIDQMTIKALIVLGVLLIVGFCSRLTALAAAGLLVSFYLVMPPWPGVVEFRQLPGPDHSLFIDKNLIEVFALLAIASMPTGKWFGIDAMLSRLFRRRRVASPAPSSTQTSEKAVASSAG